VFTLPLAYIAGMAGWVVAEVGRQPWAIQDLLPVSAASSNLDVASVKLSFFIVLLIFTVLFIAATGIMLNIIRKGPEDDAGGVVKTIK
jgi:cytochrome d ubiquinol oxidase subunit I